MVLTIAIGLMACQSGSPTSPALRRQQFAFADSGRCDTTTHRGVSVRASWFTLTGTDEASQAINDSLVHLVVGNVLGWLDSATVAAHPSARQHLAEAARLFADDYRTVAIDNQFMNGCWELQTECDTVFASPTVLTIRQQTYAFTGGAHPNTYTGYISFDRKTGHALRVTDMVSDTVAFLRQVEKAFRQKKGLTPHQNLEAEGYFLRDGRFFLPDNIAIGRTGLICYYNPYEIASYAEGPIEVIVKSEM